MGLVPKDDDGGALWFGIGIHIALAEWYKKGKRRGPHPAETFSNWVGDEIQYIARSREEWEDRTKWEEAGELGIEMLENYVDEYGKDSRWIVIASELPFMVTITHEGKGIARFASTWDLLYRDEEDGRIYLGEHKTAGQISTPYLELDDQGGGYWALAGPYLRAKGILKPGEEIAGINYNFLRKAHKDDRPRNAHGAYLNKDGTVSKRQPPPLFVRHLVERTPSEQRSQLERFAAEVRWMNAVRDGTLPLIKNTTRDCTWCPFFDMCKLHEKGGDKYKQIMNALYVRQDPYADKRKSAA